MNLMTQTILNYFSHMFLLYDMTSTRGAHSFTVILVGIDDSSGNHKQDCVSDIEKGMNPSIISAWTTGKY